jgi:hypothetical protein
MNISDNDFQKEVIEENKLPVLVDTMEKSKSSKLMLTRIKRPQVNTAS